MKSVPPPGANGAMMRTGLVGYCWLWAKPAARASSANSALRRIGVIFVGKIKQTPAVTPGPAGWQVRSEARANPDRDFVLAVRAERARVLPAFLETHMVGRQVHLGAAVEVIEDRAVERRLLPGHSRRDAGRIFVPIEDEALAAQARVVRLDVHPARLVVQLSRRREA